MTTYASTGVDIEAGDRAVELMRSAVTRTHGAEVVGGVGGFAGVFDATALTQYRKPYLVTSTDGVGTKVAIAQALDRHDTIGFDLVGMVLDDIVVCGAKPLFMTDYIATGSVVPERIAAIVEGIARACEYAGAALIGGETAEHPGLLGPGEYDVAGAATGVVEADSLLGPGRVRAGDVLLGMSSSGLHSNGYSLARAIVADQGWQWSQTFDELDGASIGDALLEPTRVYTPSCLALAEAGLVHAFTHVTGGGIGSNLARVLPPGLMGTVWRASWPSSPLVELLAAAGQVPRADLEQTFNLGIGMIAIVPAAQVEEATALLAANGETVHEMGTVDLVPADGLTADSSMTVVTGTKGVNGGVAVLRDGARPTRS